MALSQWPWETSETAVVQPQVGQGSPVTAYMPQGGRKSWRWVSTPVEEGLSQRPTASMAPKTRMPKRDQSRTVILVGVAGPVAAGLGARVRVGPAAAGARSSLLMAVYDNRGRGRILNSEW